MPRPLAQAASRLRAPNLQALDRWEFSALVLAILVAAVWLAARGLESQADLRQRLHIAQLRAAATSPVAYRKPVPVTHGLLAGSAGAPVLALRLDSLADPAEADRLCAVLRAGAAGGAAGVAVRPLALSDEVPACARGLLAGVAVPDPARASAIRGEIHSAHLVLIGGDGRVLYNRRGIPTAGELRGTLAVLRPRPTS